MIQVSTKTRVIGVDISLNETTYAIVDIRGNILAESTFPTRSYPNINDFVKKLSDGIHAMIESNGGYEPVRSVGISAPSANYLTGCIENAPNMPWKGVVPLAAMLRDRMGIAIALANNAHVKALGERAFGAAHGMHDFVVITLGHGLGSGIFSNSRPHLGFMGFAGEVGHSCIEPNGRLCGCGKQGCLEAYCADQGISLTAREVLAETDKPSLLRKADEITPKVITECCDKGDELAIETYRRTGFYLGLGLANYASIVNPEAFIITGGIAKAGHWLLDPTRETFNKMVFQNIVGKVKILSSTLGDHERDILGASVLAWEVEEYSLFKK